MTPTDIDEHPENDADLQARLFELERQLALRWPESQVEPSLDRIRALVDLLGDPQRAYPVIHITGTNGKTSTARMVESLLRAFGLHTGLFTSPHLHSVRERIRFDGQPIEVERTLAAYADIEPYLDLIDAQSRNSGGVPLSFFEVMTALAYAAFADAPIDVAIVEVGMGGTWDATNVADGQVAVITPIALDHMAYLGDTVAQVAQEKAGIIKDHSYVIVADQDGDAIDILGARALAQEAKFAHEGSEFGLTRRDIAVGGQQLTIQGLGGTYDEIFLPLFGAHQAHNATVALAAVEAFLGGGSGQLDIDIVRDGFAEATSPGRLEVIRRAPTVVVDAAHNPHGSQALVAAIEDGFAFTHIVGVVAVLADKDAAGMLAALEPLLAEVVITRCSSPRAMDPDELAAIAVDLFGEDRVEVAPRMSDALDTAVRLADEASAQLGGGAAVLVTGSVVAVADARALFGRTGS